MTNPRIGQVQEAASVIILGLGLIAVCLSPTRAGQLGCRATELFNRHLDAVGGRALLDRIQTVLINGTAKEGEQRFAFEFRANQSGQAVVAVKIAEGNSIRFGRDRKGGMWAERMGQVRDVPSDVVTPLLVLSLAFWPQGRNPLIEDLAEATCREETEGERTVITAEAPGNTGLPRLLFDKETGILCQVGRAAFDNYTAEQGVRIPLAIQDGPRMSYAVESIRFNVAMEDSLFVRPEAKPAGPEGRTELSAPGRLQVVRRPPPANFHRGAIDRLPTYDPNSTNSWQVDVRGTDLNGLDLTDRLADLLHAHFDTKTRWPAKLPAGFEPGQIMELNKNPGLGVRTVHARGITGQGVGIGIIDQTLLVDHTEYRDRLRLYEEIHLFEASAAQMHGSAVASIAVGKTVGVAPSADLYYIAETHGAPGGEGKFEWDFSWLAKSIDRLLEINKLLPAGKRIRVISISVGWGPQQKGYAEVQAATERATHEGIFVISTSVESTHKLAFHGLGRGSLSDPEEVESYGPGSWWAAAFWSGRHRFAPGERLLVPMDNRATASPTGTEDYVSYADGGWSWSVPWIAGLYALACQVRPDITPEIFWSEALKAGRTIQIRNDSKELELGAIADPVALIERLQR